jgi:hypothetical protein
MKTDYLNRFVIIGLFWLLMAISFTVNAEQKKVFDGPDGSEYEVHYIAFESTFLDKDIARQYGLVRSKAMGVLNVSMIHVSAMGERKAVPFLLETNAKNDIQQVTHVSMSQVIEGESVYYIGQIQFREGDVMTIDLAAYPQGAIDPFRIRFAHTFYNN